MKALILGSNGQLGSDLMKTSPFEFDVFGHTRKDWDITNWYNLEFLDTAKPDIIINTTAYHNTEGCEKHPELARMVNHESVFHLSNYCNLNKIVLMHVSTDWVFDGNSDTPYTESSKVGAINAYGASKLLGEEAIRQNHESHYIVRISSVFGKSGVGGRRENFVYTMIRNGAEKSQLKVVDDIFMSPTYTLDAAKMMWNILENKREFGVYHTNNEGYCSWYTFACSIIEKAGIATEIIPVNHKLYPTMAKRPMFSAMSSELSTCGRPWEEAVHDFIGNI